MLESASRNRFPQFQLAGKLVFRNTLLWHLLGMGFVLYSEQIFVVVALQIQAVTAEEGRCGDVVCESIGETFNDRLQYLTVLNST